MKQESKGRQLEPQPSVPDPRRHLLRAVLAFVRAGKIVAECAADRPARLAGDRQANAEGRRRARHHRHRHGPLFSCPLRPTPQGHGAEINLGADIFLADGSDHYLGRICHYRECYARVACRALHCGQRQHLNDNLQIVTLSPALISAPPIDLWPRIVRRCAVPPDTESLLAELETMRRSAIGTTRQLTMQIDRAQGTCCNRRLQSWSGLDLDLPCLTAYDVNRTPSSVPTDLWATLPLGAS